MGGVLERYEVETFLAVAKELHFGRAAERLLVTTGRVSRVIKQLERRVGAPLFERTSRVVRLTPIGRRLTDDLAPLVAGIEAAVERAAEAGRGVGGRLRVAFLGEGTAHLLLRVAARFGKWHPECSVEIIEAQFATSRSGLVDGSVDMLLASFPFDGMVNGPVLLSEPRVLAVAAGHPLARAVSVSLEVLGQYPVIQYPAITSAAFKRDRTPERTPSGRPVPKGPTGHSFSEMLTLVAAGRGVLPVGAHSRTYYPRPDLAYVPISDAPPIRRGLIWRAGNTTGTVREFVRAACPTTKIT